MFEEIFEDNLIDTFYPQRPANLENVSMTLWLTMIGKVKTIMEIGSTENSQSLGSPIISCLIPKLKHRGKTILLLSNNSFYSI